MAQAFEADELNGQSLPGYLFRVGKWNFRIIASVQEKRRPPRCCQYLRTGEFGDRAVRQSLEPPLVTALCCRTQTQPLTEGTRHVGEPIGHRHQNERLERIGAGHGRSATTGEQCGMSAKR